MAVYKQPKSKYWWYKFTWNGEPIRESTKQTNKRVAEQMEAAHRTALAKGEVGIRERKRAPSLAEFATSDFLPFVRSTFAAKVKTRKFYEYGVKALQAHGPLATLPLDAITTETIAGYVAKRREAGLETSSINRELQSLRRVFTLAQEWGKVEKALPKVRMMPGEKHHERVLSAAEEVCYLGNAQPLLRDVATVLIDCGLRPEECFRLRWESVGETGIEIRYGKTDNARRRIPLSQRAQAVLEMRKSLANGSEWVFRAQTGSGHIEPASVKRQHLKACKGAAKDDKQTGEKHFEVQPFPLYTLRHTCLTRWAPHMDPWTLAYLAGHRDMAITKRYVHPQADTVRDAIEKARVARSGHTSGHTDEVASTVRMGDTAATA
jgi:integrase